MSAAARLAPPTDSSSRSNGSPSGASSVISSQALGALGVADDAGDVRAGAVGELDREAADAARGSGDEHAAAEQRTADLERAQGGEPGHGEGGGGLEGDVVGQLDDPIGGHGGELGPAALVGEADDAGAVAERAGDVPAPDRAGLAGGEPAHLAAIERDGLDLDERVGGVHLRVGRLREGDARPSGHQGSHQPARPVNTTTRRKGGRLGGEEGGVMRGPFIRKYDDHRTKRSMTVVQSNSCRVLCIILPPTRSS